MIVDGTPGPREGPERSPTGAYPHATPDPVIGALDLAPFAGI